MSNAGQIEKRPSNAWSSCSSSSWPTTTSTATMGKAAIHRDYFTSASIRILVFADRVEIANPGHLPDSLSVETIRQGRTNRRNPILTEHAAQILPYRGLGSGIIEMTIPDKPRSSLQKYRLTVQGRALQDALRKKD